MFGIYRKFKWLFTTAKGIEHLSHIASLVAVCIGLYAILYPDTVSRYLDRISKSTADTAENTALTANNTRSLSDEIPYWIEVSQLHGRFERDCGERCLIYIELVNSSNYSFSNVGISVSSGSDVVFHVPRATIPARERIAVLARVSYGVDGICIKGQSKKTGQTYYDYRQLKLVDEASYQTHEGSGYELKPMVAIEREFGGANKSDLCR